MQPVSSNGLRILVVEDEEAVRNAMVSTVERELRDLKRSGTVHAEASALPALRALRAEHFDLLIIDYHLGGGMSGAELLDSVVDPFALQQVILVSGRTQEELVHIVSARYRDGADRFRFLEKPASALAVRSRLAEALNALDRRPLPQPIASAAEWLSNSEPGMYRISHLRDLIETSVKYCASLLAAEAVQSGVLPLTQASKILSTPLTFGPWVELMRELALNSQWGSHPFLLELPGAIRRSDGLLSVAQAFKPARDQHLGHGHTQAPGFYEKLANDHLSRAKSLINGLEFLARYPVAVVEDVDLVPSGQRYRLRTLMGPSETGRVVYWESADRFSKGTVIAVAPPRRALSLHPWLLRRACHECRADRTFLLDNGFGGRFVWNSRCDHRYESEDASQQVRDLLAG